MGKDHVWLFMREPVLSVLRIYYIRGQVDLINGMRLQQNWKPTSLKFNQCLINLGTLDISRISIAACHFRPLDLLDWQTYYCE